MPNEALTLATQLSERQKWNARDYLFPDVGPLRRELYPKHEMVFGGGADYRERIFIAANRVGKTVVGCYETTCHATGEYPKWWKGWRVNKPVTIWVAGDTGKTTRDILQNKLLGPVGEFGSGLIPRKAIGRYLSKTGVADAIEVVYVKSKFGGYSTIYFKSYDQRREGFQGTEVDFIQPDEEPPQDIYTEMLLRTMTTNGRILTTFTPLMGLSDVVLQFCAGGEIVEGPISTSKFVVSCDWDSVPHLSKKDKDDLYAAIPPFQRDARSKGIPQLGSGAIYQVPESEILVDDFDMPESWRRVYAMDVGWNRTAALWGAHDVENDIVYCYSEHYRGQAEPVIHAQAIKGRGKWIRGVIDPASRGRTQTDGHSLIDMYRDLGLDLSMANNAVEAGIYEVWERLSSGRLKIFKSLGNLRSEYRIYRRDEKGRIVKKDDHLLDCLRYLIMSGLENAKPKKLVEKKEIVYGDFTGLTEGWMQ
jgi:phage terminase large subunit-like protein